MAEENNEVKITPPMATGQLLADDYNDLRDSVVNEIKRRINMCSGNKRFNKFTYTENNVKQVKAGDLIKKEQVNLLSALYQINNPPPGVTGNSFKNINDYNDLLQASVFDGCYKLLGSLGGNNNQPYSSTNQGGYGSNQNGGCRGACIGLCNRNCISICADSCTSNCTESCKDNCKTNCTGGCSDTCMDVCSNNCTGGCVGSCTNTSASSATQSV